MGKLYLNVKKSKFCVSASTIFNIVANQNAFVGTFYGSSAFKHSFKSISPERSQQYYIKDAEGKIAALVDEHEITKKAYEQANEIISNAQKNAREIRLGTRDYADSVLNKVEDILKDTIDVIKMNREEIK